jgi:hypothetical protein
MDGFVETVKLVGAISGMATALFIVYDRLFRDRPIFALHAKHYVASGRENDVYLRIKNVTDEDIVIDEISITPPHFTLAVDTEFDSMVRAISAEFNPVVVGPLGERLVRVCRKRCGVGWRRQGGGGAAREGVLRRGPEAGEDHVRVHPRSIAQTAKA